MNKEMGPEVKINRPIYLLKNVTNDKSDAGKHCMLQLDEKYFMSVHNRFNVNTSETLSSSRHC